MKKNDFRMGMAKLMAFYDKFTFPVVPENSNDELKFQVWYEALSMIDNFSYVIEYYCKTQDFAPQSPRSILKVYEEIEKERSGVLTADEAWEYVIGRLRTYGIKTEYNSYMQPINRFYSGMGETIKKACKEIESRLDGIESKDVPFVAKDFKEIYNRLIEKESKNNVLKIGADEQVKLT